MADWQPSGCRVRQEQLPIFPQSLAGRADLAAEKAHLGSKLNSPLFFFHMHGFVPVAASGLHSEQDGSRTNKIPARP